MSLSPYTAPALSDDDVAPVQVLDYVLRCWITCQVLNYVLRCGITLAKRCIACSGVVLLVQVLYYFYGSYRILGGAEAAGVKLP
jgi:hypothetical protein